MLKVGITGGIGSGKSTVSRVFSLLGIPVFRADDAARYLMENDAALKAQLVALLGPDIYKEGQLQKTVVAEAIFGHPELRQQLNAIVHPATIKYGADWLLQQKTPYVLKEAAIFFESGSNREMDFMIGVFAPEPIRVERAVKRGTTRARVVNIVASQMEETQKMALCNAVIINDNDQAIIPQVLSLHQQLLLLANK